MPATHKGQRRFCVLCGQGMPAGANGFRLVETRGFSLPAMTRLWLCEKHGEEIVGLLAKRFELYEKPARRRREHLRVHAS